jgi:hypothetical protein
MARSENNWYDRQALISKLITYVAILIFIAGIGWCGYNLYSRSASAASGAATSPAATAGATAPAATANYDLPLLVGIGTIAIPALLVGLSAIIDLLIVNAEAMRSRR